MRGVEATLHPQRVVRSTLLERSREGCIFGVPDSPLETGGNMKKPFVAPTIREESSLADVTLVSVVGIPT